MSGREREAESFRDFKFAEMVRTGRVIPLPILFSSAAKQSRDESLARGSEGIKDSQERRARGTSGRDKIASIAIKRFCYAGQKMKFSYIFDLLGDALFLVALVVTFRPIIPLLLAWFKQ